MSRPSIPRARRPGIRGAALVTGLACALSSAAASELATLSLEELLKVPVQGASKFDEDARDVAATVGLITREDIRRNGWRTLDEALDSLPGLYVTHDRQYHYLGARGFSTPGDYNTRVLVAVNGHRINEVTYDSGPMGRQLPIDLEMVERIEYIAGPGGAIHGQNAMLGVVNIVTGLGTGTGTRALASVQSRSRGVDLFTGLRTPIGEAWQLELAASVMRARGEDVPLSFGSAGGPVVVRGRDGERDQDLMLRLSRRSFAFDVIAGDWRKDDPTGAYLSDPLATTTYQGDRYVVAGLESHHAPMADTDLTVRLFHGESRYRSDMPYGGVPVLSVTRSRWYGGEARLRYTGWRSHTVLVGIEAQRNPHVVQSVIDTSSPDTPLTVSTPGWRAGVFVQDQWRIGPMLSATLGLRADRSDRAGLRTSPRAGLIARPDDATTLKLLYGRAHRPPNAFERDYADGLTQVVNPSLSGERVDTWEAVADRRLGPRSGVRASVYTWRMRDLVVLGIDPVSGLTQYQSGGDVATRGVELSGDHATVGRVVIRGSLTLLDVGDIDGRTPVNVPRHLLKLQVRGPLGGAWHAAGSWRAEGSRRTLAGQRLPVASVVDLMLTREVGQAGELQLGVRDLLGRAQAHPGADTNWQDAIPQQGRSLRLQWRRVLR